MAFLVTDKTLDSADGYYVRWNKGTDLNLQTITNGTAGFLDGINEADITGTIAAGFKIAIMVDSTSVTAYCSTDGGTVWQEIGTAANTTFTGTFYGGVEANSTAGVPEITNVWLGLNGSGSDSGLLPKKGTITARTSTGSQAYTGVGFQAGLILFWGTLLTADGVGTPNGTFFGVACNNGGTIQQWSIAACADNAVATANAGSYSSPTNAISIHSNGSGAAASLTGQAAVTAFGADGFTLNWVDAATSAWVIHYLAIPASVITSVAAGSTNSAAAPGNQDFTGPGFSGSDLIVVANHQGNAGVRTGGGLNVGFCDGSLNQWAFGWNSTDASATAALGGAFDAANIVAAPSAAGTTSPGTWNWRGAVTSILATGFRINWSVAAAARPMLWLAMAGPEVRVGTDSMKTGSTGTKDTSLTGITPSAVMLASNGRAAGGSYPDLDSADLWNLLLGGFTPNNEGCVWMCDDDPADPTVARGASSTAKALHERNMAGTVVAEADGSLLSNGFRLNYTTVKTSQADVFGYVAIGSVPAVSSRLKRWNGSTWVVANLKRHDGSIWVPATLKKLP